MLLLQLTIFCLLPNFHTQIQFLYLPFTIIFYQAGSFRGDTYLSKLGQLECFLSLVLCHIEAQEMERTRCGRETDADDGMCCICYASKADAQFVPCSHRSCHGCISRHLLNCLRCFFCNATVLEVVKVDEKIV